MKTLALGSTEIQIKKKTIKVMHFGNMDNTIDCSVRPNVDALLGEGAFDKIVARTITVKGSPDYAYVLESRITLGELE